MSEILEDRTYFARSPMDKKHGLHVHTVISRAPNGQVHEHITLSVKPLKPQ